MAGAVFAAKPGAGLPDLPRPRRLPGPGHRPPGDRVTGPQPPRRPDGGLAGAGRGRCAGRRRSWPPRSACPRRRRSRRPSIAAPLEPAVVVAGAGSGKTETMSARVIWLVANGLVRPDQVLGLTFTTKAAGELGAGSAPGWPSCGHHLGAADSAATGAGRRADGRDVPLVRRPPGRRARAPARGRAVGPAAHRGDDLAARPAGGPHVRPGRAGAGQRRVDRRRLGAGPGRRAGRAPGRAGRAAPLDRRPAAAWTRPRRSCRGEAASGPYAEVGRLLDQGRRRGRRCCRWSSGTAGEEGDRRDRLRRPGGDRGPDRRPRSREVGRGGAGPVRGGAAGRVPGHRARAADPAARPVRRRPPGDRGRRSRPVDLRLARGERRPTCAASPSTSAPRPGNRRRCSRCRSASATTRWCWTSPTTCRRSCASTASTSACSCPARPVAPARSGARCWTTVLDEAAWLAGQVAEVWEADAPRRRAGRPGRSVAVLCRRRAQFDLVARALRDRGIPVELVGLGGLLATPEVRDLVSTLQAVSDPAAGAALARLLTGARWRIGPRDLAALGRRARSLAARTAPAGRLSPAGRLPPTGMRWRTRSRTPAWSRRWTTSARPRRTPPEGFRRLAALGAELAALRRRTAQPLPDLVADVERTLLLDVEVAAAPDRDRAAGRAHLDRFADVAADVLGGRRGAHARARSSPTWRRRGRRARPGGRAWSRSRRTGCRCSPCTRPRAWSGTSSRCPA